MDEGTPHLPDSSGTNSALVNCMVVGSAFKGAAMIWSSKISDGHAAVDKSVEA